MSSQDGHTNNGNDFVERRRAALERYLKRTAQHPVLLLDPDFREFLESGKSILLKLAVYQNSFSLKNLANLFLMQNKSTMI